MVGFEYEIDNKEYKNILLDDEINVFFSYFKYLKLRDDSFYIFGHIYRRVYWDWRSDKIDNDIYNPISRQVNRVP